MDEETEQLFDNHHELIITEACRRFGLDLDSVKRLGSFESAVYEISKGDTTHILKATDDRHRTTEQINAELDWVDYLASNDVPICRPVRSNDGDLVETLPLPDGDGRYISLILFEKAAGEFLTAETCDEHLVRTWGECLGRMHQLTVKYKPSGNVRRHHWYEDIDLQPPTALAEEQPTVVGRIEETIARLRAMPAAPDAYGLVHQDLHHDNFKIVDGQLRVFDTDDCQYDWLAADVAIPLFYIYHSLKIGNQSLGHARWFFGHFLDGYRRHHQIRNEWLKHIPDFLKLRAMILYMIIFKEDIAESDPWCKQFTEGRRQSIEENLPVIDLDFTAF